ncbi:hypothetical protein DCS_05121 [Drechmeria coniospora]|uniref:Aminoglycoside phosphotransferase domain-containing protein n=1 Tax=Drechmeria coniospora TaxID=98403 RepID=A0A151GM06_DRECN|nr:hypothetical protein DCS_05121 [Drechmeria coniospora]KYK58108.1 hypothetical protein DCS_05121 [Drechmeria coniospora]ODA83053.1 hypothetical protein RJ55_01562 [Drechmeria coniospora]
MNDLFTSLGMPPPLTVERMQVTANFHTIYMVQFDSSSSLGPFILRLSGSQIPRIKSTNEVATMKWLAENTTIPVPTIVRYDVTDENPIGREYTLLECIPGCSVDRMYSSMSEKAKRHLVEQLADMLIQLNSVEWKHVGGLSMDGDGHVVPGRLLEDTFWMGPDMEEIWPRESFDRLNPQGPFDSHADFAEAYLQCAIHGISVHPTLSWLADLVPRIRNLIALLPTLTSLCRSRLILAHKDLHHANIMALPDGTVTAILDWEFAGVVPALRWDPVRAFLHPWTDEDPAVQTKEKERMWRFFEQVLERKGVKRWWEAEKEVEDVWTVVTHCRALVDVCPRGAKGGKIAGWRAKIEKAMTHLGV